MHELVLSGVKTTQSVMGAKRRIFLALKIEVHRFYFTRKYNADPVILSLEKEFYFSNKPVCDEIKYFPFTALNGCK